MLNVANLAPELRTASRTFVDAAAPDFAGLVHSTSSAEPLNVLVTKTYSNVPRSVEYIFNKVDERPGVRAAMEGIRNLEVGADGHVVDALGNVVQPDVVIARGGASHTEHDLSVLSAFERQGIPVVNPADTVRTAGNKLRTHEKAAELGIDMMPAVGVQHADLVENPVATMRDALERLGPESGQGVVLKPPSDKGGHGVLFVSDTRPEKLASIAGALAERGAPFGQVIARGETSGRTVEINSEDAAERIAQVRSALQQLDGEDIQLIGTSANGRARPVDVGHAEERGLYSIATMLLEGGHASPEIDMEQWSHLGTGGDVRVYVSNDPGGKAKVLGQIERVAGDGQAAANVSQGGISRSVELEPEHRSNALKAAKGFNLTGAVDFIKGPDGKPVMVEINTSAGTTAAIDAKAGGSLADAVVDSAIAQGTRRRAQLDAIA